MSHFKLPIAVFGQGLLAITDTEWLRLQFGARTDDEIKELMSMVKTAKGDDDSGKRFDNPDLKFLVEECYLGWTPWTIQENPTNVPSARVKQVVAEHQPKVIDLVISSSAEAIAKIFDLEVPAYQTITNSFGAEARKELALLIVGTLQANPIVDQIAADSLLNLTITLGLEGHVNTYDPETGEFTNVSELIAAKEVDADALQNALNSNQQPVAEGIPAENVVLEEEEEAPTVPAIIVPQASSISDMLLRIIKQGENEARNRVARMEAVMALMGAEVEAARDAQGFYNELVTTFDPSTALPSGETTEEVPATTEEVAE